MDIGKLPNSALRRLVIEKIKIKDKRVLSSAGVGTDCGILDFGETHCVVSSDPITGATENIGRLAIHVACNDIAACGVRPTAVLTTVLLPPEAPEAQLEQVIDDMLRAAEALNVSVIGGHTEVTDAVRRVVVSVTAIGASPKTELPASMSLSIKRIFAPPME
jgi:hydrogenase expression/formation protein HypE